MKRFFPVQGRAGRKGRKTPWSGFFAATMLAVSLYGCGGTSPDTPAVAALRADGRIIEAHERWLLPATGNHEAWAEAVPLPLALQPQNAITPGLTEGGALTAELRALSDGRRLVLRLSWADGSEDRYSTAHTDRFADALAVQFATDEGGTLPYIGMGEPQRPVQLWFWRAGRGVEALSAHGFGTLEGDASLTAPTIEAERTADGWVVTLSGPLPASPNPLPLSIAVWDGAEQGRDGRKRLSAWHLLTLPGRPIDRARSEALAEEGRSGGDAQNGERLVQEHGCIACHRLPGGAATEIGPDLSHAGALHWPGYLRRAINEPSAFVLPRAAYRTPGTETTPASLMPTLGLPPAEVEDIVAYLLTLNPD